jgi:predicted nucleic acid-binding protein
VTYVDALVALAYLLVEERRPAMALWQTALITSRLLEYEVWCRLHALGLGGARGNAARELLARITMIELSPVVLARALEPFPIPLRSRDALHLASIGFLRGRRPQPRLASYDERLLRAAAAMGIDVQEPG